jgi:hypothetical protein
LISIASLDVFLYRLLRPPKQDSAAEAQLAQRKAELDTREKALAEREKAVVNGKSHYKVSGHSLRPSVAQAGCSTQGGES